MTPGSFHGFTGYLGCRAHTVNSHVSFNPFNAIAHPRISICVTPTLRTRRGGEFVHLKQRRVIHSSDRKSSTMIEYSGTTSPPPSTDQNRAPLSVLPLSMIVRSLGTNTVSSSPLLLPLSLRLMTVLAHSTNALLNPDKNPILRKALKKSFYAQFCAGECAPEVRQTIAQLKGIGFTGVILGYAKEVVMSNRQAQPSQTSKFIDETREMIEKEINAWTRGTLETVRLAAPGDCVALKFTGAGRAAIHRLSQRLPPSPYLAQSINSICQLASECNVRLLFDAEQNLLQDGIDDWAMSFARRFNKSPECATIYNTYQAYKKCTPDVLSRHLADAQKRGFSLGIKLVRGAYLGSDPRECFHDTKTGTDACYNNLAASILTRQWSSTLKGEGEFPATHLLLATHNAESVRCARAICDAGGAKSSIAFAQLQGMADEISCELIDASHSTMALPVYKYLVWGSTGECMKYLLRRAQENKDAVQRTRDCRNAMWTELVRRCKNVLSLAPR